MPAWHGPEIAWWRKNWRVSSAWLRSLRPCYLALGKGSGVERDVGGANRFGLHGNALLSRYPIRDARAIPLPNGVDKMAHREKRLGRQAAVVATIDFPGRPVQAVSLHLDAQSTQAHRFRRCATCLSSLTRRCLP